MEQLNETLEQRRERINAEMQKLQEEEAALARQAREVEEEAMREKYRQELAIKQQKFATHAHTIMSAIFNALLIAVESKDYFTSTVFDGSNITINGEEINIDIEQHQTKTGAYRYTYPEGMFDIYLNRYRNSQSRYPAKKDKTHSYDKIAATIIYNYESEIAWNAREKIAIVNKDSSQLIVDTIKIHFGLNSYSSLVSPSMTDAGKIVLQLDKMEVSPQIARQILQILKDNNLFSYHK